jgi:predicted DNA binding CopG/RHH family protein
MKRRVPEMRTDEEAEAFLASDLSDLDFGQFKPTRFRLPDKVGSRRTRKSSVRSDAASTAAIDPVTAKSHK